MEDLIIILMQENCILCGELFPSSQPLTPYLKNFFNLQSFINVLFTLNCFLGKFDEYFNVCKKLHV